MDGWRDGCDTVDGPNGTRFGTIWYSIDDEFVCRFVHALVPFLAGSFITRGARERKKEEGRMKKKIAFSRNAAEDS